MRHLLELFLFFLFLMGACDWYIYRRHIMQWKHTWIRRLYWLPSILLLIGMMGVYFTYEPRPQAMNRLGIFLILFLCINVPKAIFILTTWLFNGLARRIHRHFYKNYMGLSVALLTMAYLIFGATEGKQHFQVKEVSIESKDIPEGFDGYRIVQLSDIHAGSWGENTQAMQKAVNIINALDADLIVFTGDLVNNLSTELDAFIPVFSQLKSKDGVYSVLGNHDYSTYIQWDTPADQEEQLESLKQKQMQMGWKLLNNQHVILYKHTDSLALIGVENSGRPPFPDRAKLSESMKDTEGMFKILLSHDPSHWRREVLPNTDIQLTLAGHTHAMQTKFFGFTPATFVYRESSGLYQEGEQMLYVNIGLGHLLYPMRLGAWPEITLLTLKRK